MASFWTDLLASLSNANTGGRFDLAKAVYGVTPEGRQRRASQVGLEGAEQGAAVSEANSRRAMSQQLGQYLQSNNVAGLPFDAQRTQIRNARLAGDTAMEGLRQSTDRFNRELQDVADLRQAGRPVSELGQTEDYRVKSLGLQREQVHGEQDFRDRSLEQSAIRTGIDAAQLGQFQFDPQGRPTMDMATVLDELFTRLGLPKPDRMAGKDVSDADRKRAMAIHGAGGYPPTAAPTPAPAMPPGVRPEFGGGGQPRPSIQERERLRQMLLEMLK